MLVRHLRYTVHKTAGAYNYTNPAKRARYHFPGYEPGKFKLSFNYYYVLLLISKNENTRCTLMKGLRRTRVPIGVEPMLFILVLFAVSASKLFWSLPKESNLAT